MWNSATGWEWIGPWLTEQVAQWETYALLALAAVAFVVLILTRSQVTALNIGTRMALSSFPSLVAVVAWWALSPPAFRFAWGALFTLTTVPIGLGLRALLSNRPTARPAQLLLAAATIPVLGVVTYSALYRLDTVAMTREHPIDLGIEFTLKVAPLQIAEVDPIPLESGLVMVRPVPTDQCWSAFPLCTPDPNPRLAPMAGGWEQGFFLRED